MLARLHRTVQTALFLGFVAAQFPGAVLAQGTTSWAPQRADRGGVSTASNYATSAPVNAESAIRRAQYRPGSQFTSSTQAGGVTARMADRSGVTTAMGHRQSPASSRGIAAQYGIELRQGEQIVGQPTIKEGGPAGPTTPSPTGTPETLPSPDSVSGRRQPGTVHEGPVFQDGGVFSEGGGFHDGTVIPGDGYLHDEHGHGDEYSVDPGFDYHGGGCASGNCGGGFVADEWADPVRCPDCGFYGYHRPGCGRVAWCLYNCVGPLIREWSIFSGSQGFKGPVDLGRNGNFGFNQGVNLAGPIIPFPRCGIGYQAGARFTQTNLVGNPFGSGTRSQTFLTFGLFHRASRVPCGHGCGHEGCSDGIFRGQSPDGTANQYSGWQWGVAYDWLTDNYYTKDTLAQVRGELSFVFRSGNELGAWITQGTKSDFNNAFPTLLLNPADQYAFFFRHTRPTGSQGRIWGGFTGQSLGLVGMDFRVPISNRFDFTGGMNYNIPTGGQNANSQTRESFGIGMNLVFYFGRPPRGTHNTPFRPLFNVADNNSFMLDPF